MVSYFTQQLFANKPAEYLREMDCYKVPFDEISVMFLNQNMNINDDNQALILHALNGVIVGLGVTHRMNDNLVINQPPFKKRKFNEKNGKQMDNEWKLNVIDHDEYDDGNG